MLLTQCRAARLVLVLHVSSSVGPAFRHRVYRVQSADNRSIINSEKDVLKASDKMAQETSSAAAKLPPYGQSEGPDLQDILTHSATLLTQLGDAYRTFAGHEASLRVCFKRIREREEKLDEMRRSRRTMTSKAEAAERKLSKMGAENKQLLQQTELLERLRAEMRQIDADIVVEESKLGDFKRQ